MSFAAAIWLLLLQVVSGTSALPRQVDVPVRVGAMAQLPEVTGETVRVSHVPRRPL